MKILFLGDVVGRAGRELALTLLPDLKQKMALDFIVARLWGWGESSLVWAGTSIA